MPQAFRYDGTEYQMIDQDRMTFAEARAIEKVTGHSFKEIADDEHVSGSTTVTQAMLWVSMKRTTPELKFSDMDDMAIGAFEFDDDEPAEDVEPDPTEPVEAEPSSSAD